MTVLTGRHVFITGSTQGIGREIALSAARGGAAVVLHGLTDDEHAAATRDAFRDLRQTPALITGTLAEPLPDAARHIAHQAFAVDPALDTLVCNAGTYIDQPFLEMDYATFARTMNLNVGAQFVLVQEFARRWVAGGIAGRILLVGSINGRLSEPTHVAYDTSKGAVEAMVRSLCVTLAPHGIRVNGIAPGLFRTPLTSAALDQPGVLSWMQLHTPNRQVPGPDAAAEAAVFLLSDGAAHIHGQMLFVDGGMSIWQQPDPPSDWSR